MRTDRIDWIWKRQRNHWPIQHWFGRWHKRRRRRIRNGNPNTKCFLAYIHYTAIHPRMYQRDRDICDPLEMASAKPIDNVPYKVHINIFVLYWPFHRSSQYVYVVLARISSRLYCRIIVLLCFNFMIPYSWIIYENEYSFLLYNF